MIPICFCIPTDCSECYEHNVSYCPDEINISAGLTPSDTLYLWIRDKFNNIWDDIITVNADGSFDINMSNFPTGMFTPSFGSIDIFLTTDAKGQSVQEMSFDTQEYNCLILTVDNPVYLTDDSGCNILTSDDDEPLIAE